MILLDPDTSYIKVVKMSALDDVVLRIEAVALLRRLKKYFKYKELGDHFGLDVPLLSKYVRGRLLPGRKRAREIIEKTYDLIDMDQVLKDSLAPSIYNFFDLTNLSATSPDLLLYTAIQAYRIYKNSRITKILSLEGGGLIIAALIAAFLNKRLVYAIRDHYIADAIIEPYPALTGAAAKYTTFIALPKKSISPEDNLLIVDDIIYTGSTIKILLKIVEKIGSSVTGIFCLGVVSEKAVKSIEKEFGVKVRHLIKSKLI